MMLVEIEAMPSQEMADRENVAGAFVNYWIASEDADQAREMACAELQEDGWAIVEVVRVCALAPDDANGPDGEMIQAALEDGISMVFHMWPGEGEDAAG